jgi:methyltransferase
MLFAIILLLVALARVVELIIANRNTRALMAKGAVEIGRNQYPFIVLFHVAWLAALAIAIPDAAPADPYWLGLFVLLLAARVWVIASLGRYWTTRIVTLADAPLVRRGPYRFLRHPNYLVVALEIPVLPMAFGLWPIALGFGIVNLVLLAWRIRVEDRALAMRREGMSAA